MFQVYESHYIVNWCFQQTWNNALLLTRIDGSVFDDHWELPPWTGKNNCHLKMVEASVLGPNTEKRWIRSCNKRFLSHSCSFKVLPQNTKRKKKDWGVFQTIVSANCSLCMWEMDILSHCTWKKPFRKPTQPRAVTLGHKGRHQTHISSNSSWGTIHGIINHEKPHMVLAAGWCSAG